MRHTLHLELPPIVVEHLAAGHQRYQWDCALCVRVAELRANEREDQPCPPSSSF